MGDGGKPRFAPPPPRPTPGLSSVHAATPPASHNAGSEQTLVPRNNDLVFCLADHTPRAAFSLSAAFIPLSRGAKRAAHTHLLADCTVPHPLHHQGHRAGRRH